MSQLTKLIKLNTDEDPSASPTIIKFIYYCVCGEGRILLLPLIHMLCQ